MAEKRPYLSTTKEEADAHRKATATKTNFNTEVPNEYIDAGDPSKLVARRDMVNKISDLQASGKLTHSDAGYHLEGNPQLFKDELFRDSLHKVKLYNDDLAAQKKLKDKEKAAVGVTANITNNQDPSGTAAKDATTGKTLVKNTKKGNPGPMMDQFANYWETLDSKDKWRTGLLLTDVASTAVGYMPGAHIASAGVGAAATLGYAGIDFSDDNVSGWDATKNLAFGLSLDALSLFGGKGFKAGKSIANLAPILKKALPAMKASLMGYATYGGLTAIQKTEWKSLLEDKDISEWGMEDYANAAAAAQFLLGAGKSIGRGINSKVAQGNATNTKMVGDVQVERGAVGKLKAKAVQGARSMQGSYTKYERPMAYAGEQVAARLVGKPSQLDIRANKKVINSSSKAAKVAGADASKATHLQKRSGQALDAAGNRVSGSVQKAKDGKVRVGYDNYANKEAIPFRAAQNKPASPMAGMTPATPTKLSSKIKKPPTSRVVGYGDLFNPQPRTAPIPKVATKPVKVQHMTGPGTTGPAPRPKPVNGKNLPAELPADVSKNSGKYKKKLDKKIRKDIKKRKSVQDDHIANKKTAAEATAKKAEADNKVTKAKNTQDSMNAALEPKASGKVNKMQQELDNDIKKLKAKTEPQIKAAEKQKVELEAKLKKTESKSAKSKIEKEIKSIENVIKNQRKALKNTLATRQAAINKEAGNKYKKLYRAPSEFIGGKAVPWTNKQITKLTKKAPISGSDIRHMKNVDRAEDAKRKKVKNRKDDTSKYIKKTMDFRKKKLGKKSIGGKFVQSFQDGGKFAKLADQIKDELGSWTKGDFGALIAEYGKLNPEDRAKVDSAYKAKYKKDLKTSVSLSGDSQLELYNQHVTSAPKLAPKKSNTPYYGKTFMPEIVPPWISDPTNTTNVDDRENVAEHNKNQEDTEKARLEAEKAVAAAKKAQEDAWEAKYGNLEYDDELVSQDELGKMADFEQEDEEIQAGKDMDAYLKTVKHDDLPKDKKFGWKDGVGMLAGNINFGEVFNLVNLFKKPKEFQAHYRPVVGNTYSQRLVKNMPGYNELKGQLSTPAYNVKSSDLMAKSSLQKRNLDIKNKSLRQLQGENAAYIDSAEQFNLGQRDKSKESAVNALNTNNQMLNQREMMDAQGRARQETELSQRKNDLIGSIGGQLSHTAGQINEGVAETYLQNKDNKYNHFLDFAQTRRASMDPNNKMSDLEFQSRTRNEYKSLYGTDPGDSEFKADYEDSANRYKRASKLVKRNAYYKPEV